MARRKIIIDCDPGQDDALMLFLAIASPEELEILGITAVAGNVPLAKTARNTLILRELADAESIPVFAGCDRPTVRSLLTAEHVHGKEGLDGMDLFEPSNGLEKDHAVDFIISTLLAADDNDITLVPTGPLTNIAVALEREPAIRPKIREIVLMGGAMREGGNITPSAEFNIFVDPHAAKTVFECGRPITVFGLDVTHQVFTSPEILDRFKAIDNKVAQASFGMLAYFGRFDADKYGVTGAPLHDPCTVAYLLQPNLFELKTCNISIETESPVTVGHTAVDFWGVTELPKNAQWAYKVDADGFFDLLVDRVARY